MKTTFLFFLSAFLVLSCSPDDEATRQATSMKITLQSNNGTPVSNIVVYAYDERTWEVIGDDPLFADYQAASDSSGIATFSNLDSDLTFNELSNFTHTFRFSARYSINGSNRIKFIAVTFNKGDQKTQELVLD